LNVLDVAVVQVMSMDIICLTSVLAVAAQVAQLAIGQTDVLVT
jgi:hypothetical protein